jgi:aspartate/methionine/tyrosine aminotransferase
MADLGLSKRTNWSLEENALSRAVCIARAEGRDLIDLTRSNPTVSGFDYGYASLWPFKDNDALHYDPQPLGLVTARDAVSAYYADHGAALAPGRICLTTSTSEAYSFLFRLLCDPGDEVLVASPSYPLFEYLARLDDVILREYPLRYDPNADAEHGWSIDTDALEAAITPRCRAVLLVHPNNPTGNYVSLSECLALESICVRHGLSLIVDEVFLDYALNPETPGSFATGALGCLTFVLSGISKVCALPQMKVSWIAVCGPKDKASDAMARLEIIADTFLSMNLPMQLALPLWLAERRKIQTQVLQRMQDNLTSLDARLEGTQAHRLQMQAGWTAILRVPRTVGDLPFEMAALQRGALVQPGEYYGLPQGRIVLSLLTPPKDWVQGLERLPFHGYL